MSIEREFLKKLRYATHLENNLRKELEELLAQPEQEPVAWIATGIGGGTAVGWYEKDIIKLPKGTKLYLQPSKREPLSDKEITKNTPKLIHIGERLAFHAGVRFAERHHIIGGGE